MRTKENASLESHGLMLDTRTLLVACLQEPLLGSFGQDHVYSEICNRFELLSDFHS